MNINELRGQGEQSGDQEWFFLKEKICDELQVRVLSWLELREMMYLFLRSKNASHLSPY